MFGGIHEVVAPLPGFIARDTLLYDLASGTEWYIEGCYKGRVLKRREMSHSIASDVDGVEILRNGPWYHESLGVIVDGIPTTGCCWYDG